MNLAHVKEIARTHGPVAAMHDLAKRGISRFVPLQILTTMVVTMDTLDPKYLEPRPEYEGGFATEAELFDWAKTPRYELDAAFLRDALAKGDRCYALRDGKTLAAYGWYSRKPTNIDDTLRLHFSPRYVYMYKGFTDKPYRGKRLHASGMAKALEAYTNEGAAGMVSYVDSTNFASLTSCERMGYRNTGYIGIITVAGRTFTTSTGRDQDFRMHVEVIG